eukprot:9331696-Pyramimonas_sp.AAC.1
MTTRKVRKGELPVRKTRQGRTCFLKLQTYVMGVMQECVESSTLAMPEAEKHSPAAAMERWTKGIAGC